MPTFIKRATMSVDAEEEDVLLSEFDTVLSAPPQRPVLDDMVERDVEADLQDIRRPLPATAINSEAIEETVTQSVLLRTKGVHFTLVESGIWQMSYGQWANTVTFQPAIFTDKPSLRLMTWGDPLFHQLLTQVL